MVTAQVKHSREGKVSPDGAIADIGRSSGARRAPNGHRTEINRAGAVHCYCGGSVGDTRAVFKGSRGVKCAPAHIDRVIRASYPGLSAIGDRAPREVEGAIASSIVAHEKASGREDAGPADIDRACLSRGVGDLKISGIGSRGLGEVAGDIEDAPGGAAHEDSAARHEVAREVRRAGADGGRAVPGVRSAGEGECARAGFSEGARAADIAGEGLVICAVVNEGAAIADGSRVAA